jgi:hypothetical protein
MKNRSILIAVLLSLVISAAAQRPNIRNAKVEESSAVAGLQTAIDSVLRRQSGPLWIGYRIPVVPRERNLCCWIGIGPSSGGDNCCTGCKMDADEKGTVRGPNCASLEPVPYGFVLLRAESGAITKARVFSVDCPLDFNGMLLQWIEQVDPRQSVELLATLAQSPDGSTDKKGLSHQAVRAIALHNTPAADQALEKLMQPEQPLALRENVAFWLGVERAKPGLDLLWKYVKEDQDERFRDQATLAFAQSKEPEAIKDLVAMAHTDPSPRVRGQAIFWLAQIGGSREAAQVTAAIENDPDTQVKKKAVFALSQMSDGEGIPLLIQVAKTNSNPAVRKQAFFWLGQSHDPRALDFLEEILTK